MIGNRLEHDQMTGPWRARLAVAAASVTSFCSRALGRGHGTSIGGQVALVLEPGLLTQLAVHKTVWAVSGTNGKSSTTRMIATALGANGPVAFSRGANLPQGWIDPLTKPVRDVVLEVDEMFVGRMVAEVRPAILVLLNLSRDQLDRLNETRGVARHWRNTLAKVDYPLVVVANADDPLLAWAARDYQDVVWVAAGSEWNETSTLCPSCGALWEVRPPSPWRCRCGFARPEPQWWIEGQTLHGPHNASSPITTGLPGRCNTANAAVAAVAASRRGMAIEEACAALEPLRAVDGRFVIRPFENHNIRVILAKNPASWMATLDLLRQHPTPLVMCINARGPDGRDTSWLWDIPFESLPDITVVASGERRLDLALRLEVAGISCHVHADPLDAIRQIDEVDVSIVATYTAFHDVLDALNVAW